MLKISQPIPGNRYQGKIIGETERYVVQEHIGQPGHVILHERHRLSPSTLDPIGQAVDIAYPHLEKQISRDLER